MSTRTIIAIGVVVVVILVALFIANSALRNSESDDRPKLATLQDLIGGKFPSASDKQGKNGVLVEVDNLQVKSVYGTSDGDWHVEVTDGELPVFITEVTPYWQAHGVTKPVVGSVIDEVGYAYCDTNHANEVWHGSTCWEIHPIIKWTLTSGTPQYAVSPSAFQSTGGIWLSMVTIGKIVSVRQGREGESSGLSEQISGD